MSSVMSPYHHPSKSWLPVINSGVMPVPAISASHAVLVYFQPLRSPQSERSPATATASTPRERHHASARLNISVESGVVT